MTILVTGKTNLLHYDFNYKLMNSIYLEVVAIQSICKNIKYYLFLWVKQCISVNYIIFLFIIYSRDFALC